MQKIRSLIIKQTKEASSSSSSSTILSTSPPLAFPPDAYAFQLYPLILRLLHHLVWLLFPSDPDQSRLRVGVGVGVAKRRPGMEFAKVERVPNNSIMASVHKFPPVKTGRLGALWR
jgi:hypothetical protein